MAIDSVALTPTFGVELTGIVDIRDLLDDVTIGRLLEALKWRGLVLIRAVHLDDHAQLGFTRMLGDVCAPDGKEIVTFTRDPTTSASVSYVTATFRWHIDGYTPDIPVKTSVLTARNIGKAEAPTEFANTYVAYESLPPTERSRYEGLRVLHSFEATQRDVISEPTEEQLADWRAMPSHESRLVWRRRDGRTSLVLGATADHVVGMAADQSRQLLDRLLAWTTQERFCYSHHWQVGDVVVWDNTGILHRAADYAESSKRTLHRTTVKGDEAWS